MNEKCCVRMGPILKGYSTVSVGSYDDLIRTYMIVVTRNDTVHSLRLDKTQLSQHFLAAGLVVGVCRIGRYDRTNMNFFLNFAYIHKCRIHCYLLTPWSRVLLEKLTGFAASQEIPRIYGT
jgi:hypothetical protein